MIFDVKTNTQLIVNALKTHGCALVKGVFPPEIMLQFYQRAKLVLHTLNQLYEEKKLPAHYDAFYQKGTIPFFSVHDLDRPDEPPYQLIHYFSTTIMAEVINDYFGSQAFWVDPRSTVIRRVLPGLENRVPFHQEGPYIKSDIPMLTCWVPLLNCGINTPSLEMITVRLKEMMPALNNPCREIPEPLVLKQFEEYCWHPTVEAGDLMIFDHYCVHRTHTTPDMFQERYSMEIRSIPALQCPPSLRKEELLTIMKPVEQC